VTWYSDFKCSVPKKKLVLRPPYARSNLEMLK
jgi:hypothetical protein